MDEPEAPSWRRSKSPRRDTAARARKKCDRLERRIEDWLPTPIDEDAGMQRDSTKRSIRPSLYVIASSKPRPGLSRLALRRTPYPHPHLVMIMIELHLVGHGTLPAQPDHFLLAVQWKPPGLRVTHRQGVDSARAEPLEFGFANGIRALSQPWSTHSRVVGCCNPPKGMA